MRELLKRQREQAARIKKEVKREGFATTIYDDSDDDISIVTRNPTKRRRVETIDLTTED